MCEPRIPPATSEFPPMRRHSWIVKNCLHGRREGERGRRVRHHEGRWAARVSDAGFGLIECIVAMTVLIVSILPMTYLLTSLTQQSATARARITAEGIAEQWLEYYNNLSLTNGFPSNPNGVVKTSVTTVNGAAFTATISMQWAEAGESGNLCNTGSVPQIVDVLAVVTWGQNNSVSESTVANPPYGLISPTTGFLAVQVAKATGAVQQFTPPALPINYSISSGGSVLTTGTVPEGGCIFAQENTGSYTVTLTSPTSSPWSYVGTAQETTAQTTLTVASELTSYGTITYDQGGAVNLSYPSETSVADGVACPIAGTCFTWGREQTGARLLVDRAGSWSSVTLPTLTGGNAITGIAGVSCLTATLCVAATIGSTASPLANVLAINPVTSTATALTLPAGVSIRTLAGVSCLTTSCALAGTLATTGAGGVILTADGTVVTSVADPGLTSTPAVEGLTGVTCATGTTTCFAWGQSTASTGIIINGTTTSGAQATLPANVTNITGMSCAPTSPSLCVAAAQTSSAPTLLASTTAGATWSTPTTLPAITGVGPLSCWSATACAAAVQVGSGSSETNAEITTTDAGVTWTTSPTYPSGVTSITSLSCTSSTSCITAYLSGSSGSVATLSGSTWTVSTQPYTQDTFFGQAACASDGNCLVAGESAVQPIAFVSSDNGTTWTAASAAAPAGIGGLTGTGLTALGLPISWDNSQYATTASSLSAPYVSSTTANPTQLANLFPFAIDPYTLWSGDCTWNQPPSADLTSFMLQPGTTFPSNNSSLTVPMNYLAFKVVDNSGLPVSGATAALTVATSIPQTVGSPAACNANTYSLPSSDGDGTVEAAVPYTSANETMNYTLTISGTPLGAPHSITTNTSLAITGAGVTIGGTINPATGAVTGGTFAPFSQPIQVVL